MKIEIEMTNEKLYLIDYNDSLESFLQKVQFEQGNAYFVSTQNDHLIINKIVRFKPLEK